MKLMLSLPGLALVPLVMVGQAYFYEKVPGRANDVGVGPDGSVWIVGHGVAWSNAQVYRWNGVGFEPDGATKGMSITVGADGLPWLVTADGSIYRRSATAWQKVAGKGFDIAAGADGSVWLIGWLGDPVAFPTQSGAIYRWSGAGWTEMGGAARRISVGPDGEAWIVTGQGDIFRRPADAWVKVPGRGSDIACGRDDSIWLIGYVPGGLNDRPLYRWDGATWLQPGGNGIRLAAGPNGFPWLVASNGDVYRLHQLQTPQVVGTQASHAGGVFQVTIPTQPGVTYSLRYKSDWTAPTWLTAETYRGDGSKRTLHDVGASDRQRIYRVDAAAP